MEMRKEYLKHLETHKKQGLYKCTWPTCGKKFPTSKGLREHYEKHQTKPQCEICGKFYSSMRSLRFHKRTYHAIMGVEKYECPHADCNAITRNKAEYDKHFQRHKKPFRYQCKQPSCPTGGNPQLGHTLTDTRNHHFAGQSSVDQQDCSNDVHPSENFINLDKPDGNIFNGLNIPDNVVVDIEDIDIEDVIDIPDDVNILDDFEIFCHK
ncbi:hypothetical protein LOAG_00679 [Loa loa]|uniref:C2H2-type domain-containing protein n=1 Tax=Loa loa TaxID=7209 RepID=A0A1S0UAM8_LOALO|nr:hypothetical protein LOAG_00679 [Loa loa]EFO27813.1 hypothetical protein LOAG_00679 [Loa loa]